MNEIVKSHRVGVVSLMDKKGGIGVSSMQNPSPHFEPLAEVEKAAFSVMKFINLRK